LENSAASKVATDLNAARETRRGRGNECGQICRILKGCRFEIDVIAEFGAGKVEGTDEARVVNHTSLEARTGEVDRARKDSCPA